MKFQVIKYCAILFIFLSFNVSNIFTQENNIKDLQNLSIEDLMKIVVTASKQEENIKDAPAIIDVITSDFISKTNPETLYDLISLLPGIEKYESYWGRVFLNFRGIQNVHYSNKSLFMVNGNPYFEPILGSYFLEQIPINSIEKIEVIKGPGSALYGTNAFSGVINIITKKSAKKNTTDNKLSYGSNELTKFETHNSIIIGDFKMFVSGSISNSIGYPVRVKNDEKGRSKDVRVKYNPANLFINLKYGNLNAEAGYLHLHRSLYGITYNLDYSGVHHYKTYFTNLNYSFKIKKSKLLIRLHYNKFDNPETTIGYFPFKGFADHEESITELTKNSDNFNSEIQINSPLNKNISNVSGISYSYSRSSPYLFKWSSDGTRHPSTSYDDAQISYSISGYSQFSYKIDKWNIVGGLRLVKERDISEMFVLPRIGFVYSLTPESSLKILYGKAFRSPTFFEKYVNTHNVLVGTTDLLTENIQTFDLGYEYYASGSDRYRINMFIELTNQGIVRVPTKNPEVDGKDASIYTNLGELFVYGLELSLEWQINKKLNYGINFSIKKGERETNNISEDLLGNANINANGWINYTLKNININVTNQYIGTRKGNSLRIVDNEMIGEYEIDPYLLTNIQASYSYNSVLVSLTLRNIFNQKYYYSEYIRNLSEKLPGNPGRTFEIGVKYNFNF